MADENGVWRTVGGRRVFIKDGQTLDEAMKASGKFPSARKKTPYEALMGKEYTGVKGQDAIDTLVREKQGHVKNAFYHEDIGGIDLFWGDETAGLCHIIGQRQKDRINIEKFLKELPTIIERGKVGDNRGNFDRENIYYGGKVIVIAYELRGTEATAMLTAFNTKKA